MHIASNLEVMLRWNEVEGLLERSFHGSEFNAGYGPGRPIEHTREGVGGNLGFEVSHALAEASDGELVGGVFCLPAVRPGDSYDADIGWMCTAPELGIQRAVVLHGLVTVVKMGLGNAGYRRIVTSMGTPSGAKVISRHYGFEYSPMPDMPNRWVASLEV